MSTTTARTGIRVGIVSALALALTPLVGLAPAVACSCAQASEARHYEGADVVFKGTVQKVTKPSGKKPSSAPVTYTLAPTKVYKGEAAEPQPVRTSGSGASCGVTLSGRQHYLIFANRDGNGQLAMTICGGTRPIGEDEEPGFAVAPAEQPADQPTDQDPGGGSNGGEDTPDLMELIGDLLGGGAPSGSPR